MIIREIHENELQDALSLVLDVFMEYEAPDYSEEGVETFKTTGIEDKEYVASLKIHGAFIHDQLVGVIATRNSGAHIALFFVKGEYHQQGIGKALFQTVLEKTNKDTITVNSSPYAKDVYHHMGFIDLDEEQTVGGVRFIPMVFHRNKVNIKALLSEMTGKDNSEGYKALQKLEEISDESGLLYPYTDMFLSMIADKKYAVRVRGFRLFCKQAKWDADNKLDKNIQEALRILNDEKPTAVRQALAALHEVIIYKPNLRKTVCSAVATINYHKYKETVGSLIAKDIQKLLDNAGTEY